MKLTNVFKCLAALALPSYMMAQPVWTQIELSGQQVSYYEYSPSTIIEQPLSTTSKRPSNTFTFQTSGGNIRSVCPYLDNVNKSVYFYLGSTHIGDGTHYPTAPSSEFNVSALDTGIKGIQFVADVSGTATGNTDEYATVAMYYSDDPCTAASTEYGFNYDLSKHLNFYYSTYSNCENNACHKTNTPSQDPSNLWSTQVDQISITNLGTDSHGGNRYIYNMYIFPDSGAPKGYKFKIELLGL